LSEKGEAADLSAYGLFFDKYCKQCAQSRFLGAGSTCIIDIVYI